MNRRAVLALAAGSVCGTRFALAISSEGARRFALLLSEDSCEESRKGTAGFFEELAKLGHVEGRNLIVEWHCFGGDYTRAARVAADLVRRRVDVIFTTGSAATRILQAATNAIPIITHVSDPVANGFTRSLVRPDGNVTGFAQRHPDTPGKEVELIRRVAPKAKRLVIIGKFGYPGARELLSPFEAAVKAARLVPDVRLVDGAGLNRVVTEMKGSRTQFAVIVHGDIRSMGEVAQLALRHGVATMWINNTGYVEHGGLMSFDTIIENRMQREMAILDKLLRGIKPADIPWELPDRAHFAINLSTAKALGLAVPADVLVRADQVVE